MDGGMKKYPITTSVGRHIVRHVAALAVVIVATMVLVALRHLLTVQNIALIYLLPVMISTVLWGLTPGLLAGFSAFLAFNYYFLLPYHTFRVHETQDLITMFMFLIVAVVVSQLIGQAREGTRLARSREWEATRMYELISTLAGLGETRSVAAALARHTLLAFECVQVDVDGADIPRVIWTAAGEVSELVVSSMPTTKIALRTARGVEGEMRLWQATARISPEQNRLLEAFAGQGALALERIRLARGEHKARLLEESDQMKSSLLNSVSHELRSPLAAIKASVSSLRSGAVSWDLPARTELLATIEEETDDLNMLVGNLLDMSRIESGALKPHRRWNSIAEIGQGVVARMHKSLKNHRVEIDLPDSLPLVPTDYVLIEQVFTNLISNGIKYAPADSLIRISGRQEGDTLHIQVSNQGPPVPEEHLERIFDKFYRVTEGTRITGTGLGLSICKGIIEAHHGKIWAENQPGGFLFHFTLPLTLDGALPQSLQESIDG